MTGGRREGKRVGESGDRRREGSEGREGEGLFEHSFLRFPVLLPVSDSNLSLDTPLYSSMTT
eukprot:610243-Hanusia_phi.AAC.1